MRLDLENEEELLCEAGGKRKEKSLARSRTFRCPSRSKAEVAEVGK